jgi:hypothetical protein
MRVAVSAPGGEQEHIFPYPQPLAPGLIRVAQVRVRRMAVTFPASARSGVWWVPARGDARLWGSVVIVAEPAATRITEATSILGTASISRVQRADGGTIAVVAGAMRESEGRLNVRTPDVTDELHAAMATRPLRALVHGLNPDGSLWFLELVNEVTARAAGVAS